MTVRRVCEGTGRFLHCIKEGGSWGKHGFPHGNEPEANDAHEWIASTGSGALPVSAGLPFRTAWRAPRVPYS